MGGIVVDRQAGFQKFPLHRSYPIAKVSPGQKPAQGFRGIVRQTKEFDIAAILMLRYHFVQLGKFLDARLASDEPAFQDQVFPLGVFLIEFAPVQGRERKGRYFRTFLFQLAQRGKGLIPDGRSDPFVGLRRQSVQLQIRVAIVGSKLYRDVLARGKFLEESLLG